MKWRPGSCAADSTPRNRDKACRRRRRSPHRAAGAPAAWRRSARAGSAPRLIAPAPRRPRTCRPWRAATAPRRPRPRARRRQVDEARHLVFQRRKREPGIADQRDLGRIVGANRRRIDIDVHHPDLARHRMAPALRRDRARPAADEHDEVRLIDDRPGGRRAAVAAHHPECQRMVVRDATLAADRGRNRRFEQLGKRFELGLRAGDYRSATADEERALGRERWPEPPPRSQPARAPFVSPDRPRVSGRRRPRPRRPTHAARRTAGRSGPRPAGPWSCAGRRRARSRGSSPPDRSPGSIWSAAGTALPGRAR